MAKGKKQKSERSGQPAQGTDPAGPTPDDRASDESWGVFKVSLEGAERTLRPEELTEPELGEWLPEFTPPDTYGLTARGLDDDNDLLPAWAGSYDGAVDGFQDYLLDRSIQGGHDDRTRVTNTSQWPYRSICQLLITARTGRRYLGTGWLGGNRVVYTAGHCTFMHREGGLASSIVVCPGRNGSHKPYPAMRAVNWGCTSEWEQRKTQEGDVGCIFLDQDCTRIGQFGFDHPYSEDDILNLKLHVAGYPGDKSAGQMWGHANRATRVYRRQIKYLMDTMGGQSGAPVFDSRGMVVGIHNYGGSSGNLATRITPEVKKTLKAWWRMSGSTR